jgi:hypothetical protein
MLHVWLIPALAVLSILVLGFYVLLRYRGGSGLRSDGRALVDEKTDEPDPPPPF